MPILAFLKNRSSLTKLHQERMQAYAEVIKQLQLDPLKKKQINVNFLNFIDVLHLLARKHMKLNDFTNVFVIILSAVVPIMINVGIEPGTTATTETTVDLFYIKLATILSVTLAILNAFRQSYKYRERFQSHLETAEQLILEGQSYFSLSGKYAMFSNHDTAFQKFMESVNLLRNNQINKYINQLLSVNDKDILQAEAREVTERSIAINKAKNKTALRVLINKEINDFVRSDTSIAYFEIDHDIMLITLFVNVNNFTAPEKFHFKDVRLAGVVYRVQTVFAEAEIQSDIVVSTGVKNKDMPNRGFGSAACILKLADDTPVLVTCYHVVKHSSQSWDLFLPGSHDEVVDVDGNVIGKIIDGEKSATLDSALIALSPGVKFDELLPGQVKIQEPFFVDEDNMHEFQEVFILSRRRNFRRIQGKLAQVDKTVTLNYGSKFNPDLKNLDGLMIVHFISTEPFTLDGDSGSLVFLPDGTAIGMIVGGDNKRASFVIPFTTINDQYNFKFT